MGERRPTLPQSWPRLAKATIREMPESMWPTKPETKHRERYRAFILFAMMDIRTRNMNRLRTALNKPYNTVRYWRDKHEWVERLQTIDEVTPGIAARWAIRLYKIWWQLRYGNHEVAIIQRFMSAPYETGDAPVDPQVIAANDDSMTPLERQQAQRELDEDEDSQRYLRRQMKILDAVIAKAIPDVRGGKLKIKSITDLATACKVRNELGTMLGDFAAPGTAGTAVQESYRVRLARSTGTDVLEARMADCREVLSVLEGAKAAREVAEDLRVVEDEEDVAIA